jgi:hypothetical protein
MQPRERATAEAGPPSQPSPVAPAPAGPARRSDYAELSRRVRQAGLLERRRSRYAWRITVTALLLAA